MASFNESGTEPVERQSLTISVNTGAILSIHSSSSEVGIRSRSQVLGDIFLHNFRNLNTWDGSNFCSHGWPPTPREGIGGRRGREVSTSNNITVRPKS